MNVRNLGIVHTFLVLYKDLPIDLMIMQGSHRVVILEFMTSSNDMKIEDV